jgi:hypothetical protein
MEATTSSTSHGAASRALPVIAGGVFAVVLFFWPQFFSDFRNLYGEAFDGAIEKVLISHWWAVLRGLQHWNQPLYFYPRADVLGYNDGYLLYGLIGAAFRAFGVDVMRAGELAHVVVRLIGYFSMYALLQRMASGRLINIAVAVLFTIALNALSGPHLQLLAVSFAPAMTLLGLWALDALREGRAARSCAMLVAWAALYGAWLLTAYYMAFFFALFLLVFAISYAVIAPREVRAYARLLAARWPVVMVFVIAFALSCVPFLHVYLPKLQETGGQSIQTALDYAQWPVDLLNIGAQSLVWGRLWAAVNDATPGLFRGGEHVVGYQPVFLAAFVIGAVLAFRAKNRVLMALAVAAAVLAIVVMKVGDASLWTVVYHVVPGAKGMRVICRMFILAVFPMSFLVAVALHRARRAKAVIGAVVALLILEQVNAVPRALTYVPAQLAALARVTAPPAECKAFYAINPSPFKSWSQDAMNLYVNVQAMQVADVANLPTINGVATFLPSDWDFNGVPAETYVSRMKNFAAAHGITGLCQYDITAGKWSVAD